MILFHKYQYLNFFKTKVEMYKLILVVDLKIFFFLIVLVSLIL